MCHLLAGAELALSRMMVGAPPTPAPWRCCGGASWGGLAMSRWSVRGEWREGGQELERRLLAAEEREAKGGVAWGPAATAPGLMLVRGRA